MGEVSGDMTGMLEKTANFHDGEVSDATKRLLTLLQPVMIVIMAGLVVLIVLAVFCQF